jgi:hypothetical protein
MRTLYKHITECHTQTNNRDTNQREHYINILPNATHKQITVITIRENIICHTQTNNLKVIVPVSLIIFL